MQKNVVVSRKGDVMEADVVALQDWDGFDSLAGYLQSQHHATPTEKLDGPESRVWKFSIGDSLISLHNNPDGNYFKATGDESQKALQKIVADLEQRLADPVPVESGSIRAAANQPCPQAGFWFTPAKVGSRRYFKLGDTMPDVGGDYGATIWQWDQNQDPPKF
jgi:hypothetical protein